ncbi:MAG: tRNA threonylcarbamoyladenosine dehydratase [Clostridia bacterium]|nr:tRNA threonylcarbamoyladenosine dehydratase [Clostridia bacterium]
MQDTKTCETRFSRTEMLLGKEAVRSLASRRVAVFGVGGVGGFAVEALVRSGIGFLDLIDSDKVCLSNLNRQIIATENTLGMYKVDAARDRALSINPECIVNTHKVFYLPETADMFDFTEYDYIIDAIDTVSGKLMLVEAANAAGVPIICSMGAGNKLDPTAFRVADIYKTSVCPLARVMRRELKKRGIKKLKVVYSTEEPVEHKDSDIEYEKSLLPLGSKRRATPGSVAFVPSVVGLIIAGKVIKDLTKQV